MLKQFFFLTWSIALSCFAVGCITERQQCFANLNEKINYCEFLSFYAAPGLVSSPNPQTVNTLVSLCAIRMQQEADCNKSSKKYRPVLTSPI